MVTLDDGTEQDFVYFCEAEPWFEHWGVDPEDDPGKESLALERVAAVKDSPSRLPAQLADKMYQAGESAMGGCIFQLRLSEGATLTCETGNAVDFLAWPPGVTPADVVDLLPHAGRLASEKIREAPFSWCLYEA